MIDRCVFPRIFCFPERRHGEASVAGARAHIPLSQKHEKHTPRAESRESLQPTDASERARALGFSAPHPSVD